MVHMHHTMHQQKGEHQVYITKFDSNKSTWFDDMIGLMVSSWSSWFSRCKFGLLGVYTKVMIYHHFLWQPSEADYKPTF